MPTSFTASGGGGPSPARAANKTLPGVQNIAMPAAAPAATQNTQPQFKTFDDWVDYIEKNGGTKAIRSGNVPPPPGVSPSYWESQVVNNGALYSSRDFWGDNEKPDGSINRNVYNHLKQAAQKVSSSWSGLSPQEQQTFSGYDASGNPHTFGSPEAENWAAEERTAGVAERNKQAFEDWKEGPGSDQRWANIEADKTDKAALDAFNKELKQFTPADVRKYAGDVTSQAAGAQADPATIKARQDALEQIKNAGASQADIARQQAAHGAIASAGASQADLARQQGAFDSIKDAGASQQDVATQRSYLDTIKNAGADAEDIQAQRELLGQTRGLTGTAITAEEKLMMELSRRQMEGDLRANREALRNDLQARGVYGSGAEITQNAMAQQEAAQRRALENLGAQANAQKRALSALEMAGTQAAGIRTAGADESLRRAGLGSDLATNMRNAGADESLRRAGLSTDAAARMREAGAKESLERAGLAVDSAGNMRDASGRESLERAGLVSTHTGEDRRQSFDESFKRGTAADDAAKANQIARHQHNIYVSGTQNDSARTGAQVAATRLQGAQGVSGASAERAKSEAELGLEGAKIATGQAGSDNSQQNDIDKLQSQLAFLQGKKSGF